MDLKDKTIVITGAGSGIGRALALVLATKQPRHVICADLDKQNAHDTASVINGIAYGVDVGCDAEVGQMIDTIEREIAPIDVFCSNAGILRIGGLETSLDDWQKSWDINVMAHVSAARHLVPRMRARGGGYFLNVASAAGLLNQIGAASYGVSKHAAVGFSEWLAITHGDQGIGVSVVCPQAVQTPMTRGLENSAASVDGMITAEDVATLCVEAIEKEEFLVLPHPNVKAYMQAKTANYGRWITGMQRLRDKFGMPQAD
ncbi:SDR family NAD(P)-dependent oxidoreductase [Phaeobacter porticola]|uniref:Short-chain dehydrogenase with variable specificity n=1 Tax=Phaeobacter porticola TaxID=1844006 RepID=A0A1L3I4E6_9RHOB|nr:SDR family NAD(P)-dependent oxidoreductase [Phaeobacter porticola]APG46998.1 Short-chain dehydrogenase with variable specificity [Phaeobacter porticola]